MKHKIISSIFLLSFLITSCIPDIVGGRGSVDVSEPGPTPQADEKILSSFNPIQGTDYLMAAIVTSPVTRDRSVNPFDWISNSGYSSYSSGTYNYVFFNLNTEQYKKLLPTNEYSIIKTTGFPVREYDPEEPDKPAPTIEWWLFNIAKADTNNDGRTDFQDKLTIGLSNVSGNGYTELIQNVDEPLGEIYKDSSAMFIMYNSDGKNYIAKINPSTREVVSTTEMDLGEDVK